MRRTNHEDIRSRQGRYLDAAGPSSIYSVSLWIYSKDDSNAFTSLDSQHAGGNTWSAMTYAYVPLPPGNYYLDSIMIEDGDSFAGRQVRSGWYMVNSMLSSTRVSVVSAENQ